MSKRKDQSAKIATTSRTKAGRKTIRSKITAQKVDRERDTKASRIAAKIKNLIRHNSPPFMVGQDLPVLAELCSMPELACSKNTMLKILGALEAQTILRRNATYTVMGSAGTLPPVSPIAVEADNNWRQIDEALELRETLEAIASRRAASVFEETAHYQVKWIAIERELSRCFDRRDFATSQSISEEVVADQRFHQLIYDLVGNPYLQSAVARLREFLHSSIGHNVRKLHEKREYRRRNFDGHMAILNAIRAKDAPAAELAARAHIKFVREQLQELRAKIDP